MTVYFKLPSGEKKPAEAKIGDNMLDVVMENNLDIDGFGENQFVLAALQFDVMYRKPRNRSLLEIGNTVLRTLDGLCVGLITFFPK